MTERRRFLTDHSQDRNVMTVRELLNEEDEQTLSELRGYETQLNQMLVTFRNAISELDSSTANLDREIRSFTILDLFFNDPEGMNRIQAYLDDLYELVENETLNSVTSSIALSALGILEALREIQLENPGFQLQLNQLQTYIEQVREENEHLQTELVSARTEAEDSKNVLDLSEQVSSEHEVLQAKVDKFHKNEILRNGHVRRALDTCISTGLFSTIGVSTIKEKERAMQNLMDFVLECLQDIPL